MKVGILALQGAVGAHAAVLDDLGVASVAVRAPGDLEGIDALVVPGGESTTIAHLIGLNDLFDPLADRLAAGLPVLGTCAGLILLATRVLDGRPDQRSFGVLDLTVRRNAFGRQVDSFEAHLTVSGVSDPDRPLPAVFIRAPVVEAVGPGVDVWAAVDGHPVCVRQGAALATAFHPELSGDRRIHESFLQLVGAPPGA